MAGVGLRAAVEGACRERATIHTDCWRIIEGLSLIWMRVFHQGDFSRLLEQEPEAARTELQRTLVGRLEPFQDGFVRAFDGARAVLTAPGGSSLAELRKQHRAAGRGVDALTGALRVHMRDADVKAMRSARANAVRHKDERADAAHLRDWYAAWRRDWLRDNPGQRVNVATAAGVADATRQVCLSHQTIYRKLLSFERGMSSP